MLLPKNRKYRKAFQRKGNKSFQRVSHHQSKLYFGSYGLKAAAAGDVSARQLESIRVTLAKSMDRRGKIWLRVYPSVPKSKKPTEVRMGKGKGAVNRWIACVQEGNVLVEVAGLPAYALKEALNKAARKLPIPTNICFNNDYLYL